MYSLGVILHIIFVAELPSPDLQERLQESRLPGMGRVSVVGRDLVQQLLSIEPLWRPHAAKAMRHPWCAASRPSSDPSFMSGVCTPEGRLTNTDAGGSFFQKEHISRFVDLI